MTQEQVRKVIAGSIRFECKKHDYTIKQLGSAIGVNESTITGWEGNGGNVGLDDAWLMADQYGISLDQLAGRS
ncbi:MAG: helix-turn-helix transcriptional regulator [Atopobiaceae bacterium]|nr:helix-turn-helix transcriptional regulator [Atopobiaceae bacterium]